ncbi:MAG: class I SAM-dependent methyltransferase [Oscillospiraceae bacterium]
MIHRDIDAGKPFDWGLTSDDYAKYRDIYPKEFYDRITVLGLCGEGTSVLDIGTGTGVLPRALYGTGARFTGVDISENQIKQAQRLAAESNMSIDFLCSGAEDIPFAENSFDCVLACQCFWYFDHERLAEKLYSVLKSGGRFAALSMEWLPFEDKTAAATEELVLKYNPDWSGKGELVHKTVIPDAYLPYFEIESAEVFLLDVPFTRESWNGRIKACRGIGASLPPEKTAEFEKEHMELLKQIVPEKFTIKHYAAITVIRSRKQEKL